MLIHRHAQTGQVALDGICKMVGVLDYRVDLAFQHAADLFVGHLRNGLKIVSDQVLNSCLGFVRQLVALPAKILMPLYSKGSCGLVEMTIPASALVLDGEKRPPASG